MFKKFMQDEEGQGMVEYGLILALIAIVVIVALRTLGGTAKNIFSDAGNALADPANVQ